MVAIRHNAAGFPMAPSQQEWEALSPEERDAVVAALPDEVTEAEMAPPEGDRHFKAKIGPLGALRGYFARQGRRIYLAAELPVYYPAESRFAPDLLAVLDVADHDRDKWVVSAEGKGLDWVMEVHVGGDRKKDAELNVTRYARIGIREYFLYDRARSQLFAYRLASPGARTYSPIQTLRGRYESQVLGLDVQVERDRLRFHAGTALLLESDELIARLEGLLEDTQRRLEDEARRAEEEARRAVSAEAEVALLREELERLKK